MFHVKQDSYLLLESEMARKAQSFRKDPDAILDYGFDWSEWLASGEIIASSV